MSRSSATRCAFSPCCCPPRSASTVRGGGPGRGACGPGGTRTITLDGARRTARFEDCALSVDEAVHLDGTASLDAELGTLVLDGLVIRSAALRVEPSGTLRLDDGGGPITLGLADGDVLTIDDSQGELELAALDASFTEAPSAGAGTEPGTGAGSRASLAYEVRSSRAGASAAVASDGTLVYDEWLGCPSAGTLTMTLEDGRVLRLAGADGDNLALGGDLGNDTLACSEIFRLVPASGGFMPPPAPQRR